MATKPTTNPIPSESPRDLKFNAGKIDEIVNSNDDAYQDRLGKSRLTWAGIEAISKEAISNYGYITVSSFEDGFTITLPNQVLLYEANGEYYRWNGSLPKVVPAGSLPGDGWVSVGDSSLRSNLSSTSVVLGDALIAVKQPISESVARTAHDKFFEQISIKDFGAKGDGSSDDTNAFKKAFAQMALGGYWLLNIPAGRYILSDRISLTNTAATKIKISGAGSEATVLDWNSTNSGLYFVSNDSGDWWIDVDGTTPLSLHCEGMSLVNRKLITNVGIETKFNGVTGRPMMGVSFNDIVWRGYNTFDSGWAKCCVLTDTPNVKFFQCRWFQGGPTATPNTSIGVEINGTDGGDPAEFYFDQCESFYGAQWIRAGSHVEGIRLTNCTCIGERALNWQAGAESGLVVVGGHFNCSAANFYLDGIFDITINGANLYNEGHGSNSHTAITINNGGRWAITGNVFVSSTSSSGSSIALLVSNSAGGEPFGGLVDANTFHNYTDSAIVLGSGSAYSTVGSNNIYRGCTSRAVDTTGNNFIKRGSHSASYVVTFTNGGTSQGFSVALPNGLLAAKPEFCSIEPYNFGYIASYDYDSSTATSLVFNVRNIAGSAIAAGTTLRVGYCVEYI